MASRSLTWLLVLTALIVVAAVLVGRDHDRAGAAADEEPALPELRERLNDIVAIHIDTAGGTRAVTLERSSDRWTVAERDGYSADAVKVRRLVLDLAALRIREYKTADPARYADIGVQDLDAAQAEGARITVVLPDATLALIAGKPAGSRGTYVRRVGESPSALVEPAISPDRDPVLWLDRSLLRVPSDRVRSVEVRLNGRPAYAITRQSADERQFEFVGRPPAPDSDATAVGNALVQAIASLGFEDLRRTVGGGEGAAVSTVTYQSFDGLRLSIDGWKEPGSAWIALRVAADADLATEAVRTEAGALEARHAGWQYRVPAYVHDGIFRSLDDEPAG